MRILTVNPHSADLTGGIARLFASRVCLLLILLSASMIALMVPAIARADDSPSAATEITGISEVTVSATDGVNDMAAASEVAAPGTRIFLGNMLSAPVLMLMLLVVAVFAYRKKLSGQASPNAGISL